MNPEIELAIDKLLKKPDYIMFYSFQPIEKVKSLTGKDVFLYTCVEDGDVNGKRNPEFMGEFKNLSPLSIPSEQPGGSLLQQYNYYKTYMPEEKLLVCFNSDNKQTKKEIFSKITHKSLVIIIGHCCLLKPDGKLSELTSDILTLKAENGDVVQNQNKNTYYMAATFANYAPQLDIANGSSDKIIIDFYACNAAIYFVSEFTQYLYTNSLGKRILAYVIGKGKPVNRLGGLSFDIVKSSLESHYCSNEPYLFFINRLGTIEFSNIEKIINYKKTYILDMCRNFSPVFIGGNFNFFIKYLKYKQKYMNKKNL